MAWTTAIIVYLLVHNAALALRTWTDYQSDLTKFEKVQVLALSPIMYPFAFAAHGLHWFSAWSVAKQRAAMRRRSLDKYNREAGRMSAQQRREYWNDREGKF